MPPLSSRNIYISYNAKEVHFMITILAIFIMVWLNHDKLKRVDGNLSILDRRDETRFWQGCLGVGICEELLLGGLFLVILKIKLLFKRKRS